MNGTTLTQNRSRLAGLPGNPALLSVLLGLIAFALFAPAIGFEFINMDDDLYVSGNAHVLGGLSVANVIWAFDSLRLGFWHPLTWLSYQLDATLLGRGAAAFHFTNVLLHAANTVLVFLLARRLTGAHWRSAAVALLFALHPLRVEAVAWVAERKELLGAFFGLLALLAYVRYAEESRIQNSFNSGEASRTSKSKLWYLLALASFIGGLVSKPMVVTLPVIMLLLDWWPLKRTTAAARCASGGVEGRRFAVTNLLREKLPFFVAGFLSGLLTVASNFHIWRPADGAIPAIAHPFWLRVANAVISYVRYLGDMFRPLDLAPLYPFPAAYPWWMIVGAALALIGITLILVWLRRAILLAGWVWYLVTLLPVIGFIQVGPHSHADRYVYLPLVGVLWTLVWGAAELAERWRVPRPAIVVAVVLVAAACGVRTTQQLQHWRNSGTLFTHTVAVTKENSSAYALLGLYQLEARQCPEEAIANLEQALAIKPDYADAWNNLGRAQAAQGRVTDAMQSYRRAIAISPKHAPAWSNLGAALAAAGRSEEAIKCYQRALDLQPDQAVTLNNLAFALLARGRAAEAIPFYQEAVRLQSDHVGFRLNLAAAFETENRLEQAVEQYRAALRLRPDNAGAHDDLGVALQRLGRVDEAIQAHREALRLHPHQTGTLNNLGLALMRRDRLDEAIACFQDALKSSPTNEIARLNLDRALARAGKGSSSVEQPSKVASPERGR